MLINGLYQSPIPECKHIMKMSVVNWLILEYRVILDLNWDSLDCNDSADGLTQVLSLSLSMY